jgi:cellulose synthase operon protein C
MPQLYKWQFAKTRLALPALAVVVFFAAAFFWFSKHGTPEDDARSYYEHGVKLAEQHDYAKAVIELRNALRLNKNMLPAWRSLAQIEEATQHWDDLIRSLQSVVSLAPADVDARIKLVKLLALSGRVYQALELINTDDEADSRNGEILGLKAAILYKINDRLGAVRQAQQALAVDPGNADALVVLASVRMASGDLKGALQFLEKDAAISATDLGIQLLKLKIFEQLGESQQFESLLRQLTELHPKEGAFRQQLIKFYVDQHRMDDAEKEARARVRENPTNPETELDLVRLLYAAKGATAARQELIARIDAGGEVFPYQIALADFDFSQGNFAEAEQRIQNLLSHLSSNEQILAAQIKLAEIDFKRSKIDAAEAIVSEILRKDSGNTNALKVRASVRIARGQLGLAITDLQRALNDQPRSTELILLLALAYERSGSMALAEKQYADAVRISNFASAAGLNYVSFLLRRGSIDRAEQFLTELSKRSPTNLDILSTLAQVELGREDWASAQAVAESIRNTGAGRGIADQILGAALLGQQKYDESIAIFQSAVNASPSAVQPMVSLVQALMRGQKTAQAAAFLQSTLQANPDNAEAQVLMGSIQLATGARDQALESFKLAIEKQPKNVGGYRALANLYAREKKSDEALTVIRSGLQMQPDSIILQLAMAEALEQSHQYEAAISEYERILSKQPGSMIVANNLASLLSDHRNDKASLERAHTLVASLRETQIPQFKDTLGWVSYRRDDFVNAVPLLEKAAAALPNTALVRYHLAMSYMAIRQTAKASEQLRAALSLAPDSELEAKIQEALRSVQNM